MNIPNENFWMDNNWDIPQNQLPHRPPPWWNQCHPGQERPFNISFDSCIQGSYHRRPYRGHSNRGRKKTFSKGTNSFQKPSSSSCLINVMPKKTSEKVETQPENSKKIKQDKGNTETSEKEDVPSKVEPNDSQPAEESPSQPASVASPGAGTAEELPSGITEVLSHTKNEDIVLTSLQDKLKDCEATEEPLSQAVPVLSPGVSTEDKTSSCSVEDLHSTEKEDSVLLQTSQSAQHSSHVCSPTTVEIPFLSTVEIPFLSENGIDDHTERKEEIELTETSAKQNDTDDCQACVAPTLESSSLPSTLSDIRCVPVLVRERHTRMPYSWEAAPFHAEDQRGWAPEHYQEPPWNVNQADQCHKICEHHTGLLSSVSSSISFNGKHNDERLIECKSDSPKSHHSSNSKHSSTNQTSRDLRSQSPRSHGRQECSSRSSHKRQRSTERQERSSKLSCRQEHSSRTSHRQDNSPQREKHISKSPYREEQSSRKQECNSRTSPKQEHSVKSMRKQKHSSRSPLKRKQNSRSQKLDRWKENKLARGCCCHCRCHYQQSCIPSREGSWQRRSPPPYLTCKIKCLHVSKEISKVYRIPHRHSPERSIANEKKITEDRQLVEPKIIEKKKRTTSGNGRKALKSPTRKEKAKPPCHLNAEEETSSSVPSWTSKDRSAAVLARKEEIEQAYLQVLLNFGVIAIMLVEKEPCMTEAMHSALRANLRKIGNYYECLLKNYIDNLTEAS